MSAARLFRGTLIALALGGLVASGIGWSLTRGDSGVRGTNGVRPFLFVVELARGERVCQPIGNELEPSEQLRLTVGTDGAGPQPLEFEIRGEPGVVVESNYVDGVSDFSPPTAGSGDSDIVCITNSGRFPVSFAGENVKGAKLGGRVRDYSISLKTIREPRAWTTQLAPLYDRVARGQVNFGGGTAPIVGLIAALSCLAAAIFAASRVL